MLHLPQILPRPPPISFMYSAQNLRKPWSYSWPETSSDLRLKANRVGSSSARVLAAWTEPLLSRPRPRFSRGRPTGGFHGGFVASKCRSSRAAGPGFHLCSRAMRTFPVRGSARVAGGRPGQAVVQSSGHRVRIPCSETCLNRKVLFGIFISCWVPLSFG